MADEEIPTPDPTPDAPDDLPADAPEADTAVGLMALQQPAGLTVLNVSIEDEMRQSYLDYAMSTIIARALPDVRDGLKPVHRRILMAMSDLNLTPAGQHRKSAKVVGECFVAGTLVSTPRGLTPIEALNVGDTVYTQTGVRSVTEAYVMPPQPLREVAFNDGAILRCTPGQQFKVWTPDLTTVWKTADELTPGEYVMARDTCEIAKTNCPQPFLSSLLSAKADSRTTEDPEFIPGNQAVREIAKTNSLTAGKAQAVPYLAAQAKLDATDSPLAALARDFVRDRITFAQVSEVRPAPAAVTYDIQVDVDHEFIANGVLVHNCMGNYHPHGDQALYATMVRMAQDFNMRYLLVDGQGNFGCFTGDTKIKLLDGTEKSFAELAELSADEVFHVYSVNADGRIVVGEGRHSRITRQGAELVEVTLDNGERIRCTPDHRFLLRSGVYKEAQSLTPQDSLMPGYFDRTALTQGEASLSAGPEHCSYHVLFTQTLTETADVYDITVDEHHNFLLAGGVFVHNSIDADPPAAQRYTEARMAPFAMEMLQDLDRDTVDWADNYDQTRREPTVLPSKFPNFLCNGGSGIAVGMATNIPPQNLREVIDGAIHMLDHPEATSDDLMEFIKGPDFPTAGLILGQKGIRQAYATGRGSVVMQARTSIEPIEGGRNQIVITELPYQVIKSRLIEQIADLVKQKKIEGIADLNDYSDRHGMRVVVTLKREAYPKKVLNFLLKHTPLRSTFGVNMLALVGGQPQILNLPQALGYYLDHRREVITRRTLFELNKAKARAHILEGLQIALDVLDEIISLIRASRTVEIARTEMMGRYALSQLQADAILAMQLRALTGLEREKLENDYKELLKQIAFYEDILANPARLTAIIKQELRALRDKYGDERRTRIVPMEAEEIGDEDLIPEEEMIVSITRDGYIKRVPKDTFPDQKRGGKGRIGASIKEEDSIEHLFVATTHHYILFFTDRGRVYRLKAYEVPQTSRTAMGTAVINLINIQPGERITATVPMKQIKDVEGFLLFATECGEVKRTPLVEFTNLRNNGLNVFDIEENDALRWVAHTSGNDEVLLVTRKGMAIRFSEAKITPRSRSAGGVRGITLSAAKEDQVVSMVISQPDQDLLVIGERGMCKRTSLKDYPSQLRGGLGVRTMTVNEKTGDIVDAKIVSDEDRLLIMTREGITIHLRVAAIRSIGRTTQGVKAINLSDDDLVSSVERMLEGKLPAEEVVP